MEVKAKLQDKTVGEEVAPAYCRRTKERGLTDEAVQVLGGGQLLEEGSPGSFQHLEHDVGLAGGD